MYIYIHTNRRNTSSQFLGIDSSVLQLAALFGHEVSLEYINVSVHPLYWLRENTEDIPGMKARARAGARDGGGGGREGGNRYSRRRGFRCTMQAEAYIVIIIISPLDIKDLSFSLFASLSLLLLFPWPLTDPLLSLSLSFSLPSLLPASPFRATNVSSLARSFLPPRLASRPTIPFRAWLWASEKWPFVNYSAAAFLWPRYPAGDDGNAAGSQAFWMERWERERCPRNLWIRTWLFIV